MPFDRVQHEVISIEWTHVLFVFYQVVGDICYDPDLLLRNLTQAQSDAGIYQYIYIYVAVPSAQTGQHEPCKDECCPVWVLQQICWISVGK